jgi:Leucine-rich repeat (LRR) protein
MRYELQIPKSLASMKRLTKLTFNGGLNGNLPDLPFHQYTGGCVLNVGNVFGCDAFPASASQCQPGPPACSIGGCTDASLELSKADCAAWKGVVQPSPYFLKAPTPICKAPRYKYDPCSCNDTLGCDDGRIISVDLNSRGLAFNMDAEDALGHFSGLKALNVSSNSLTGPMPKWLKMFANSLVELRMVANAFTGTLDPVKELVNLEHLDVAVNSLTGSIIAVQGLTKLKKLQVDENRLSGTLDPVAALRNISVLNLKHNLFTGTVDALKRLTTLSLLWAQNNRLTGSIDALKQLTNLQGQPNPPYGFWPGLNVANNQLTGPIGAVFNMNQLRGLMLRNNSFTGMVGEGFSAQNMPNLTYIDLSVNNFSKVPSNLVNWSRFTDHCDLHHEAFTCSAVMAIPAQAKSHCGATCCVGSSADLAGGDCDAWVTFAKSTRGSDGWQDCQDSFYDPCSCRIPGQGGVRCEEGHIVDIELPCGLQGPFGALGGLENLRTLMMGCDSASDSNITGSLDDLSGLMKLESLKISDNSGRITGSLGSLENLKSLRSLVLVAGPNVTGDLKSIANARNMTQLNLRYTHGVTGDISSVSELTSLQEFRLYSQPGISGDIASISKLVDLATLELDYTNVSGSINDVFPKLVSLTGMILGHPVGSTFTGDISTFSRMPAFWHTSIISLDSTQVTGDIAVFSHFTSLTSVNLFGTPVHGDIGVFTKFQGMLYLSFEHSSVSGDASVLGTKTWFQTPKPGLWLGALKGAGLHGTLPDLNWTMFDPCDLRDNNFSCPVPHSAVQHCGAKCVG